MHNVKELKIWNKSIELAMKIYETTSRFPKEEKFGLISQMRRCAVSISSNIAEGAGRNTKGEFLQFLGIANGSCYELQTQVVIVNKLGFIDNVQSDIMLDNIDELQKMNFKFQQAIRG